MNDCRFGVSPANYPDPDWSCVRGQGSVLRSHGSEVMGKGSRAVKRGHRSKVTDQGSLFVL